MQQNGPSTCARSHHICRKAYCKLFFLLSITTRVHCTYFIFWELCVLSQMHDALAFGGCALTSFCFIGARRRASLYYEERRGCNHVGLRRALTFPISLLFIFFFPFSSTKKTALGGVSCGASISSLFSSPSTTTIVVYLLHVLSWLYVAFLYFSCGFVFKASLHIRDRPWIR